MSIVEELIADLTAEKVIVENSLTHYKKKLYALIDKYYKYNERIDLEFKFKQFTDDCENSPMESKCFSSYVNCMNAWNNEIGLHEGTCYYCEKCGTKSCYKRYNQYMLIYSNYQHACRRLHYLKNELDYWNS